MPAPVQTSKGLLHQAGCPFPSPAGEYSKVPSSPLCSQVSPPPALRQGGTIFSYPVLSVEGEELLLINLQRIKSFRDSCLWGSSLTWILKPGPMWDCEQLKNEPWSASNLLSHLPLLSSFSACLQDEPSLHGASDMLSPGSLKTAEA